MCHCDTVEIRLWVEMGLEAGVHVSGCGLLKSFDKCTYFFLLLLVFVFFFQPRKKRKNFNDRSIG